MPFISELAAHIPTALRIRSKCLGKGTGKRLYSTDLLDTLAPTDCSDLYIWLEVPLPSYFEQRRKSLLNGRSTTTTPPVSPRKEGRGVAQWVIGMLNPQSSALPTDAEQTQS